MAENEEGIVVSGGVRYTAKDAAARGIKADTAAHAKKVANGDVPVGTYVATKAGDAESIPAPVNTGATDPAPAGKAAPADKK